MNQIARRAGWRRGKKVEEDTLTDGKVALLLDEAMTVFNYENAKEYVEGVLAGAAYKAAGRPDSQWQDYYTGRLPIYSDDEHATASNTRH